VNTLRVRAWLLETASANRRQNQHDHAVTDTPEKLDYPSLARVTRGLADAVAGLAVNAAGSRL
jgi:hypothetical protein